MRPEDVHRPAAPDVVPGAGGVLVTRHQETPRRIDAARRDGRSAAGTLCQEMTPRILKAWDGTSQMLCHPHTHLPAVLHHVDATPGPGVPEPDGAILRPRHEDGGGGAAVRQAENVSRMPGHAAFQQGAAGGAVCEVDAAVAGARADQGGTVRGEQAVPNRERSVSY